jgi:putative transposase
LEHHIKIGRDALFDVLAVNGLLVRKRKRRISTTNSYHQYHKYPNLIKDFIPQKANALYVSDITYWKVGDIFLYLSLVTDAYSHKIVGFYLSDSLETVGCKRALQMAVNTSSYYRITT